MARRKNGNSSQSKSVSGLRDIPPYEDFRDDDLQMGRGEMGCLHPDPGDRLDGVAPASEERMRNLSGAEPLQRLQEETDLHGDLQHEKGLGQIPAEERKET